ncbi:MarR family transcriptional regulator [Paenibacillus sp. LHD-117]|uniref:MarR family winged helix-turn-helix transcriptional regulator n=1 Tax=Paenibacillus sp. LHD-117 TaxID=3071412 RepID=UPI0027DF2208|nr:MarR family transcriptional regulator [Paenibacillus sp. LHD-117]MDQ6419544.1 MarR family transcriptional regulator [Paenibacillus sp. LHD-117]
MQKQSIESIELELAVMVRHITSIASSRSDWTLDRSSYLLLHQIHAHGSAGVKALADEFRLDISTVSRQAAVLEQKGYARKMPDPSDGRAFTYQITDLGKGELLANKQMRQDSLTRRLAGWSDEEREQFGKLLMKFNQTFK